MESTITRAECMAIVCNWHIDKSKFFADLVDVEKDTSMKKIYANRAATHWEFFNLAKTEHDIYAKDDVSPKKRAIEYSPQPATYEVYNMTSEQKHPTLHDIASHHCGESDWCQMRAKETDREVQKKILQDKAEWHLRAAAEILTHAPNVPQ